MSQSQSLSEDVIFFPEGDHSKICHRSSNQMVLAIINYTDNPGDVFYIKSGFQICALDKSYMPLTKPKKELKAAVLLLKG